MNLHFNISEYNDRENKVVKELDKNNFLLHYYKGQYENIVP